MENDIRNLRRVFAKGILTGEDLPKNPTELLQVWLQDAIEGRVLDPNAMSVSTVDEDGYAVSRIVLLKDISTSGLSFFTNYNSAKGRDIARDSRGGAQFYWHSLERQVRVRGHFKKVPAEASDAYFKLRPRDSQIGAWASPQSEVMTTSTALDAAVTYWTEHFKDKVEVPRPPHWGGYVLAPNRMEFWQGRPNRLHDRLCASLTQDGQWIWTRLAP